MGGIASTLQHRPFEFTNYLVDGPGLHQRIDDTMDVEPGPATTLLHTHRAESLFSVQSAVGLWKTRLPILLTQDYELTAAHLRDNRTVDRISMIVKRK